MASQLAWAIVGAIGSVSSWIVAASLTATGVLLSIRERGPTSMLWALGGACSLSGVLTRRFNPTVYSISFRFPVPAENQSEIVWFLYMYGYDLGLIVVSAAALARSVRTSPRS